MGACLAWATKPRHMTHLPSPILLVVVHHRGVALFVAISRRWDVGTTVPPYLAASSHLVAIRR
jgi:hypothetical protein